MSKIVKKKECLCENPFLVLVVFFGASLIVFFLMSIIIDSVGDFFEKNKEIFEFLVLGGGGLTALYGLSVLDRRADAQVENNVLTEKGLSQERFKAAVEHLSSDKASLRISSFHELFHLAKDNEDYRQTVVETLCRHLRQETKYDNFDSSEHRNSLPEDVHSEEVVALFNILFGEEARGIFDGLHHDLRYANLSCFEFQLQEEQRKMDFRYANLSWANFAFGDLRECLFKKTKLFGTNFMVINLQGVNFEETKLSSAIFGGSDLSGAYFQDVDLYYAYFVETNLKGANFFFANLCGTNLKYAKFLETAKMEVVIYNDYTEFPKNYNPEDYSGLKHTSLDVGGRVSQLMKQKA